ncbi:unnamed protein product [Peronospora belbahrii]|uniref:PHD-type domain-containing protein n=1 Tax=Peronospora belbahrii TaxID=622444 RepID=A0AAU9KR83_9STRA|nr:unnamed protein product [Peronospora belbahrii]
MDRTSSVKPRKPRKRRAPALFSPSTTTPPRKTRKQKGSSPESDNHPPPVIVTPSRPEHKRLEKKIKSQVHRLRYSLAFIEAYETEGWRKSSREKLKPNKELEAEHDKITKGKRALIDGLHELKALNANDPQVPPHAVFEDVHCSRCGSTDIELDNDILLCDSLGCHRAYHQRCQTPLVLTANIPAGDELWFCEVCLAVFECLKSINWVFGTTYENTDDLFPELAQLEQPVKTDASSISRSGEESGSARVDEDNDEEEDEDFVCNEGDPDDEDEEESDEKTTEEIAGSEEEMVEEVPESSQDLLFLSKDDVIDPDHRSSRSKSARRPSKPIRKTSSLIGKQTAKINRKTGKVILGVVAELEPPVKGRYSRWRIDYHDGSSEMLTRSKTQAAINHAVAEDSSDDQECDKSKGEDTGDDQGGDGSEEDPMPIFRSKRKRNDVDYRQLNELMFAGKDEDSEDDETYEVKERSDDEPDEDENNGKKKKRENKMIKCLLKAYLIKSLLKVHLINRRQLP